MSEQFEPWALVAGLGLFLLAMRMLENTLREFSGAAFRRLLQNSTNKRAKAVFVGTAATALLQSSSLIGLMVLAFVGANLMALENALGVIFGANLGTTFTGWIVTTLGFELDLNAFILPLIGIGSIVQLAARGRVAALGSIVTAIGLLLMGLNFMKESVAVISTSFDISVLKNLQQWQFLALGTVLAAVIQSSSAVIVITLAALYAQIITLPAAAVMAIGADLGTTSTVMIGAIQGNSAKKRVALAQFIFNLTTDLIAFAIHPLILAGLLKMGLENPLLTLVAFHSVFNLMGIALFLPFTGIFAGLLEKLFVQPAIRASRYISQVANEVSSAAIAAVEEETAHLIARVLYQNRLVFPEQLPTPPGPLPVHFDGTIEDCELGFDRMYHNTKRLEGEILSYGLEMQTHTLDESETTRLNQLQSAVRHAVHSVKSLRDIRHDLDEFSNSVNTELASYVGHFRSIMSSIYTDLFDFSRDGDPDARFQDMADLIKRANSKHDQLHREIFADIKDNKISDEQISSLLNVNRELLNSNLALIRALKDYYFEGGPADALDLLPRSA